MVRLEYIANIFFFFNFVFSFAIVFFDRSPQQVPTDLAGRRRSDRHPLGENVHEELGLVHRVRHIHVRSEGEQTERQAVQQRRPRSGSRKPFSRRARVFQQSRQVRFRGRPLPPCEN